ncbi:MAG: acetyltransferase-like isoleucine patch superfamily enzyme [Psychroserpens sp.]|jgi:acetyltransferase-like isoleucine patch superfamily enzyme
MYDLKKLKSFGKDVYISQNVEIIRPELICTGSHIAIDSYFYISTRAIIGDHVHISAHVGVIGSKSGLLKMGNFTNISLGGRIICGSDEFLGAGLVTAPGILDEFKDNLKIQPVIFEDFVNTGANVVVLPGVTLGKGSVIGANSLVTRDTEPWTIYVGSPAKPIRIRKKEHILEYAKTMGYD